MVWDHKLTMAQTNMRNYYMVNGHPKSQCLLDIMILNLQKELLRFNCMLCKDCIGI